jgi:hypothetical protein
MVFRLKVKRGWDQACEKAYIAFGGHGMFRGKPARLMSVEMSASHILTLRFELYEFADASVKEPVCVRHWLRAMIRSHR